MSALSRTVEWKRAYRAKNLDRVRIQERAWYDKNRTRKLFLDRRCHALKRGIEFTVEFEDIRWPTHCPVLGIELQYAAGVANNASPSLDRTDNTKGYIPGNVSVISWRANRLKGDATIDELHALIKYIDSAP